MVSVCAPCHPQNLKIDFCNPATGTVQSVSYDGSATVAQAVPMAPWLLRDPKMLSKARALRVPRGVDDGTLSPVYRKRAAEGFTKAVTGTWQALVIMVDFSDNPPRKYPGTSGTDHFNQLLFSKGVYPTGSMRDWYQEVSYKQFDVTGLVTGGPTGWLRAPQTLDYYSANASGFGSYPNNSYKFGEDAIALADPYVDYSRYDNDHDGVVDALFIVHSGPGAETTGNRRDFHSCHWFGGSVQVDGVGITGFSIEPEDGEIGVFGHEFAHALGCPDLYDYGYDSFGIGSYSMMAFGTWGGNGTRPTHLDAYCKQLLGWTQPQTVTSPRTAAPLPQAETSPIVYKLGASGIGLFEYFLVENRQKVGFDGVLPASGVLIWHIETIIGSNDNQWYPPLPSNDHYLVALEQADAQWSLEKAFDMGDPGDSFPGSTNRRYFNGSGLLNSLSYSGYDGHVTVSNISASGPNMAASLCGVNRAPLPPATLEIKPFVALPTSHLKVTAYGGGDPDGDTRTFQYTWSRWNGTGWTKWGYVTTTGKLEGVSLKVGQQWRARARACDGLLYSGWRTSPTITIVRCGTTVATLTVGATAAPTRAEGAEISVNLSTAAAVEVQICNLAGRVVGQLPRQQLSAGVSNLLWNGSSINGTAVPDGTYLVKVLARGDEGTQAQALSSLSVRR
ncbi:MAG: M6 family metalloprotease domain-containing protein [Bacteroidota bacterium]